MNAFFIIKKISNFQIYKHYHPHIFKKTRKKKENYHVLREPHFNVTAINGLRFA